MVRWLRTRQGELGGITLMVLVSVATVLSVRGVPERLGVALAMTTAELGLLLGTHAPPRWRAAGLG